MMYNTGTISYDYRTRIFWFLISVIVLLVFVQILAVGTTTKNIALRQTLEEQRSSAAAESAELEFKLLALKNNINMELASTWGLREEKNPVYVARTSSDSLGTLTLNR